MTIIDRETFLELPTAEVAKLVRAAGPQVCVFPINGTRRWFILESHGESDKNIASIYDQLYDLMAARSIHIFQLLFDHGLDTILTPAYGPELLERGEEHTKMIVGGLARMTTHPAFLDFYDSYQVCVRFYGDYRNFLLETPYAYLLDMFDNLTQRTMAYNRNRLFIGLFAQDATEAVAELAVKYHSQYKSMPNRRTLVELYYGEYVDPVSLFIGFDKFSAFDMPLLATGNEDLYFTVSPSLYFDEQQLRAVLYDHLYTRRVEEPDYSVMQAEEWAWLKSFYKINRGKILGIGMERNGIWYPLPQVELPTDI
jgi:tuberculosinol/isotuberculosinol synthase